MKQILIFLLSALVGTGSVFAQSSDSPKVGWFIAPEAGVIFQEGHLGRTVGTSLGVSLFRNHLKLGIQGYGRSGPINPQEFFVEAHNGQTYKGSSTLRLRADHGTFGLFIAPTFQVGKVEVDIPVALGQLGGGFYLTGEDRNTPDGRRVSEWENQLMDGRDASFSGWAEFGVRGFIPLNSRHVSLGAGLHYTVAPGWSTYYNPSGDFYNNRLRFSLVLLMGSD